MPGARPQLRKRPLPDATAAEEAMRLHQPGRSDPRSRLCAVCARQARGFGYTHELRPDRYPTYRFCSRRCQDVGAAIAARCRGMIDKTPMEIQAIKGARRNLAEALTELGLMDAFHDRTGEEIDQIIEACIDGYQDSLHRPSLDDVPF